MMGMIRRMMGMMILLVWILGTGAGSRARDISSRMDWLTRYGYLPPPDPYSAQQQTLDGLRDAVRTMQRFAGLRETGILDKDTVAMMDKPRCSLPDIMTFGYQGHRRKRYAPSGSVWQKRHLTWRVESFPIFPSQETTRQVIEGALLAWSRETNLDFSPSGGEADLRVSFVDGAHGDGYPFDGPGGTLGHAFFPGVGASAGAMHMDADEHWTYNAADGTDLFAVAVHEFGHSLGLSHSSAENSIMKPYYQGPVGDHRTYSLPPDDVEGIQALYGKRTVDPGADVPPPPPPAPTQHIPPRRPTYRPNLPFPDRCSTHFDAVANIRGEVFFFKNRYFWRVQATRQLVSLSPAHLGRFWMGLPPDLPRVDAVYERANDSRIVFIAGTSFWVFKDTLVEPGYPRPLTDFGLDTDGVDGAFVWKHNKKTYFFRHNRYWRFDEHKGKVEPGYPKNSDLWEGLPPDVDDVISWTDGHSYFFKGTQYWKFQDGKVEAEPGYPRSIATNWMYCAAEAPPPPEPTEPEGRDQRGCNCPCAAAAAGAGLIAPPTGLMVTLTLSLLRSTW